MPTDANRSTQRNRLSLELEPRVDAARRARELVTIACARWHRESLAEPAHVAVTELVDNAVLHAGTPLTVEVAVRGDELFISVRDRSTEPPRPRVAAPTSYGGRGLMLLDAVASRWGYAPRADGKVVWAVLS